MCAGTWTGATMGSVGTRKVERFCFENNVSRWRGRRVGGWEGRRGGGGGGVVTVAGLTFGLTATPRGSRPRAVGHPPLVRARRGRRWRIACPPWARRRWHRRRAQEHPKKSPPLLARRGRRWQAAAPPQAVWQRPRRWAAVHETSPTARPPSASMTKAGKAADEGAAVILPSSPATRPSRSSSPARALRRKWRAARQPNKGRTACGRKEKG